jgi:hypothetical protein
MPTAVGRTALLLQRRFPIWVSYDHQVLTRHFVILPVIYLGREERVKALFCVLPIG